MSEHAGKMLQRKSFGPIEVTQMLHPPGARLKDHQHEKPCFTLVLAGAFQERFGSAEFFCDQSAFLYRPARAPHSDEFSRAGATALLIEPDARWLDSVIPKARLLRYPRCVHRGAGVIGARKILCELSNPDEVSELMVAGLVLQMAGQLQRSYKDERGHAIPKWLLRTRDLLESSFREPPTICQLASEANITPIHLAREFRRRFRCTPGEYIRELKVREACRLISETRFSLSEIGSACGFANQSHFNRVFRGIMAMSPGKYRAEIKS